MGRANLPGRGRSQVLTPIAPPPRQDRGRYRTAQRRRTERAHSSRPDPSLPLQSATHSDAKILGAARLDRETAHHDARYTRRLLVRTVTAGRFFARRNPKVGCLREGLRAALNEAVCR